MTKLSHQNKEVKKQPMTNKIGRVTVEEEEEKEAVDEEIEVAEVRDDVVVSAYLAADATEGSWYVVLDVPSKFVEPKALLLLLL